MSIVDADKAYSKVLQLLSAKHAQNFLAGERIFSEGEIGDKVYFVLTGVVNVFIQQHKLKRSLCTLAAGEVFGEMALLNHLPRTASVEAETEAKLIVLERETFLTLLEKYPILALKVIHLMAERMHLMNTQLKNELGVPEGRSI